MTKTSPMTLSFSRAKAFAVRSIAFATAAALLLPSAASAASAADYLSGRAAAPVSRGDFLRASVKTLRFIVGKPDRSLPYTRVTTAMLPYVKVAHERKALAMFLSGSGTDLGLGRDITRIEAALFLQKIQGAGLEKGTKAKAFTDLRGADEQIAATVAVQKGWMSPVGTTFGARQKLTVKEAKLILGRLERDLPNVNESGEITVPIVKVRVTPSMSRPETDKIDQVWDLLQSEYLYNNRLDTKKAGTKAIQGLVESLEDPYTTYMPPASAERFNDQLKGEVEGIGATVELVNGVVRVVAPVRGSPAEKAGILPLDEILSVDGKVLKDMTLDDAVTLIRGPKGSTATLRIRRNGVEFDQVVQRATVSIPEVEISSQGDITIIRIVQFGETTDTKLRQHMLDVAKKNPRGIIIDLRSNPGGLLHAAGVVVGHFVPKGSTFATISGRTGSYQEKTSEEPTINPSIPLVVLVNKGSASASEIVAGALQDAKRATIVGQKTFGKGTVQQVVQFQDRSSLKFTIAEWLTPLGRKIDGKGVEPDVVVEPETGRDAELLKALDILR